LASKMMRLVGEFQGTEQVTDRCLELISQYTSEHAASQILTGCVEILTTAPTKS
jgi:hypothetical protein